MALHALGVVMTETWHPASRQGDLLFRQHTLNRRPLQRSYRQISPCGIGGCHIEADETTPIVEDQEIRIDHRVGAGHGPIAAVGKQGLDVGELFADVLLPLALNGGIVLLVDHETGGTPNLPKDMA